MDQPRKRKTLSHGPSYNRLHGAPSRSSPDFTTLSPTSTSHLTSRPRVHFRDNILQTADYGEQQSMSRHSSRTVDPDLDQVMRHYGLDASKGDYHNPPPSSLPKISPEYTEHNQRLAAFGVSLGNRLSNAIFTYPFIVLRRQCQVNHVGRKYHLTPFTVFGVALNMQRAQGFTTLWKGIGSSLMVGGITVLSETAICELVPKLPREVSSSTSVKMVANHLWMKTASFLITIPFYSAHLVESVQSDMVSETPGVFSCIIDGFARLLGRNQSPRMLPFYRILLPTLSHFLLKYILSMLLQHLILHLMRWRERRRHEDRLSRPHESAPSVPTTPDEQKKTLLNSHYPELISSFLSELICDVALYPVETVVHRINIQGTRTIIDNTDTGRGFLPVSSRYEGFIDCFSTTIATEGYSGLYRGFGALLIQHGIKYSLIRLTKLLLKFSSSNF